MPGHWFDGLSSLHIGPAPILPSRRQVWMARGLILAEVFYVRSCRRGGVLVKLGLSEVI